jgi:hypothetical protein
VKATLFLSAAFALLFAGCGPDQKAYQSQLRNNIDSLKLQNTELNRQIEQLQQQNKQLSKQNKILAGLDPQFRYENLYNIQIKAAGAVDVELWDLNNDQNDAKLGQWEILPEQLQQLWFASIASTNYRLTFDLDEPIDNYDQPLTVKVTFTDHLTGKAFQQQKVIESR